MRRRKKKGHTLRRRYGHAGKSGKAWAVLYVGTNEGMGFTSKVDANRFIAARRALGDQLSGPRPMTAGELAGVTGWRRAPTMKGLIADLHE